MPVNLSIKNVPDNLAESLRQRAQANHRSLQGELMAVLHATLTDASAEQTRRPYIVEQTVASDPADTADIVQMIREMREERTDHLMRLVDSPGATARARQLLGLPALPTAKPTAKNRADSKQRRAEKPSRQTR